MNEVCFSCYCFDWEEEDKCNVTSGIHALILAPHTSYFYFKSTIH